MATKIGFIVGSLRAGSYNRKVAQQVEKMFPDDVEITWLEIGDLPLYNQDLDADDKRPAAWTRFMDEAGAQDGFVFFEPEYNRSLAPAIKNAIDIGSRAKPNVWKGKFASIISATHGAAGGMLANHALRQTFTYNDMVALPTPEVYLGKVESLFEDSALVKDTQEFLQSFVDAFVAFGKQLKK